MRCLPGNGLYFCGLWYNGSKLDYCATRLPPLKGQLLLLVLLCIDLTSNGLLRKGFPPLLCPILLHLFSCMISFVRLHCCYLTGNCQGWRFASCFVVFRGFLLNCKLDRLDEILISKESSVLGCQLVFKPFMRSPDNRMS